jgi:hypothetical protein
VPGRLCIGVDGSLELDPGTLDHLAGRELRLLLAPCDLLVAVEADGGATPATRMMLAGDLSHVSFPDVVSLIAQARASGVLRVAGVSGLRRVIFADGEVRGAASERVGERLDEVIVRMGLAKPEQMDPLREQAGSGHRAGRLAVEQGILSERALWNAIQEHVITIFQAVLLESRGSFMLSDERVADVPSVPGLSAEGVLMEGIRRLDELRNSGVPDADGRGAERVMAAFAGTFRDIFATAEEAGTGDALRRVAANVFEDDPDPEDSGIFEGVAFSSDGGLPEAEILRRAVEVGARDGRAPDRILQESLTTVMLFLLFVAGEHLEPGVQQALHSRVKSIVSRER